MDLNIIVAAAVLVMVAILIARFAPRTALLFMLAGFTLFLVGIGIDPLEGPLGMPEKAEASGDTKALAKEVTRDPAPIKRGIRIGVPPRTIPLPPRKKDPYH